MPPLSLEERVAALEHKVALMSDAENGCGEKPWLRTMGKFEGLKEIFEEAMKLREKDRARAHADDSPKSPPRARSINDPA